MTATQKKIEAGAPKFDLRQNVTYQVRHCAQCAIDNDNVAAGKITHDGRVCREYGTPHGVVKELFNENKLARALRKIMPGVQIPTVPRIFGFYADRRVIENLITSAGKAGAASRINGSGSEAAFTYIAVGTGTTAAAVGDTALQTELAASGLSRAAATASRVTTSVTNDTAQLVLTFTVTGTAAVTESGVLNASSSGVLLARQVFSAINVVNGDTLQVTWKFQMS